jgi:hypothetical protein
MGCLCSIHWAIKRAFSTTQGRAGIDTEYDNCQDSCVTVYQAMGNLEATVASGTVPGKDWREYLIGKTTDCIDFVLSSTNLTGDGITEKCDLVIGAHHLGLPEVVRSIIHHLLSCFCSLLCWQ